MGLVRGYLRSEIERIFAREIAKAKPAERRSLVAALSAAASMGHYTELREMESLSADEARRVMSRAISDRLS
jgi:hypothetical protein